jgi:hypothetical protein
VDEGLFLALIPGADLLISQELASDRSGLLSMPDFVIPPHVVLQLLSELTAFAGRLPVAMATSEVPCTKTLSQRMTQ